VTIFAAPYAGSYDDFYAEKDYEGECDYIEQALRRNAPGRARRVLDLGCGTGRHAMALARRGYELTGVDRSGPMLEIARSKAAAAGVAVAWQLGDITTVKLPGTFDAALFMFAVLGYLVETPDLLAALSNARAHLREGGVLLFDVWYGPAVLALRPLERSRVLQAGSRTTIRISHPVLHAERDVVDVGVRIWQIDGRSVVSDAAETHAVRYFFQPELVHYLGLAGFDAVGFHAFPNAEQGPDESTWNLGCVAIAR
jgi:SAM-dependent methyltransferase